jgi:hypothetical protein
MSATFGRHEDPKSSKPKPLTPEKPSPDKDQKPGGAHAGPKGGTK